MCAKKPPMKTSTGSPVQQDHSFSFTKEHDGSSFYSKKWALSVENGLVQEPLEISLLCLHLKTQDMSKWLHSKEMRNWHIIQAKQFMKIITHKLGVSVGSLWSSDDLGLQHSTSLTTSSPGQEWWDSQSSNIWEAVQSCILSEDTCHSNFTPSLTYQETLDTSGPHLWYVHTYIALVHLRGLF